MRDAAERLERQDIRIGYQEQILTDLEVLARAMQYIEESGNPHDFCMPIRRFNQLVEDVKILNAFYGQKRPVANEFFLYPADDNLKYVMDLKRNNIFVGREKGNRFHKERTANIEDIQENLLIAAQNLISGVCGEHPTQLALKLGVFKKLTGHVNSFEQDIRRNSGKK